jgi:uncharacterized iron-regulated membrane protein
VIRKTVFWIHLGTGVIVGLVVLMMSVTGVLLTYERQLVEWAVGDVDVPSGAERLDIPALLASLAAEEPGFTPTSVTVRASRSAPVEFGAGRAGTRYVNPYTGELLGSGPEGLMQFFGAVEGWHRWFNASGEGRAAWRSVTSVSNLAFLFLVLTGIYLWLPRVFSWTVLKTRVLFNPKARTARARDYNWHHVFGIWTALPLVVIVGSAVVFSYPWANDLVFAAFGEQAPQRGPGPPGATGGPPGVRAPSGAESAQGGATETALPIDDLLGRASAHLKGWRSISLQLPRDGDGRVRATIDQGTGGQPQRRHTLTLDARSGGVVAFEAFSSQSPGRQARSWLRFLHTGEALGILGQTLAGIVSLTTCIMVWTGLALAYRRLIAPLYRRVAAVPAAD